MPRQKREFLSRKEGSAHLISRTTGEDIRFSAAEKEYLQTLIRVFSSGFFIKIHSFTVMDNHFHILASGLEDEAEAADYSELLRRYRSIYGETKDPPQGSYCGNGGIVLDPDLGEARLRRRLASMSRFMQELKQRFSVWYNNRHHRRGCLWGGRFGSVLVQKGTPRLVCSAYIDLNALRAGMVRQPEDYRWSSIGMRVREPKQSLEWLNPVQISEEAGEFSRPWPELSCYRMFLYAVGETGREKKAAISADLCREVEKFHGKLGIGPALRFRIRNISEGLAMGTQDFIAEIQRKGERKLIRPQKFIAGMELYATRVLRT